MNQKESNGQQPSRGIEKLVENMKISGQEQEVDPDDWMQKMRMDQGTFDYLLKLVTPSFKRERCHLGPKERLTLVLRCLATGKGFDNPLNLSIIIPTCMIFNDLLPPQYFTLPKTPEKWVKICNEFEATWDIKNCLGAIYVHRFDVITDPSFKLFKSLKAQLILVMGVDADFKFTFAEVNLGVSNVDLTPTGFNDIFKVWQKDNKTTLPLPRALKNGSRASTFAFVGGDHLEAGKHFVVPSKSFEEERNSEIKRAVRPANIAHKIVTSRFGVFEIPVEQKDMMNYCGFFMVACMLHNVLLARNPAYAAEYKGAHLEGDGQKEV